MRSWYEAAKKYKGNEEYRTLNEAAIARNRLRKEGDQRWKAIQNLINIAYGSKKRFNNTGTTPGISEKAPQSKKKSVAPAQRKEQEDQSLTQILIDTARSIFGKKEKAENVVSDESKGGVTVSEAKQYAGKAKDIATAVATLNQNAPVMSGPKDLAYNTLSDVLDKEGYKDVNVKRADQQKIDRLRHFYISKKMAEEYGPLLAGALMTGHEAWNVASTWETQGDTILDKLKYQKRALPAYGADILNNLMGILHANKGDISHKEALPKTIKSSTWDW